MAKDFGNRLKAVIKRHGFTQREVARRLNINPVSMTNYVKGRIPRSEILYELCNLLGVSVGELLVGEEITAGKVLPVEEVYKDMKAIPLVGTVPAGALAEIWEHPAEVIYEPVRCSESAFAVRIMGDSMEPVLQEGDVAIVEPARVVKDGDVALVRAGGQVTVKKVLIRQSMLILQPFNHRHDPIVLTKKDGETAIIGAVIRLIRDM